MTYEQLIVDLDGFVATVRMNNGAKLNALSPTMTRELIDAMATLGNDPSVRAILLTGEGRGFSAGADLGALKEPYLRREPPKPSALLRDGYNKLIPLIAGAPKPVIAAINGVAAGAGISLALACDMRIASEQAAFATAFVKIGLIPDSGACYFLPRTVGLGNALELAMTGDTVDAARALSLGLVNRVVPPAQVLPQAHELAMRLAQLPTRAIGLIKRAFRESASMTLPQALALEADLQDEAGASEDHLEGVVAFLEKRTPLFTGR